MDGSGGNAWLPPEGIHAAASLFSLIVESELKVASASATTEDDADCLASVSAMDERLGSYALIARAAVDATIPFLAKLFSDHVARLHQVLLNDLPLEYKRKQHSFIYQSFFFSFLLLAIYAFCS
jgi:hypothetical protein